MASDLGSSTSSFVRGQGNHTPETELSKTWVDQGLGGQALVRLVESWERGEPVSIDELLVEYPSIDKAAVVELIYEEMHLKREAGIDVRTAEVIGKYPQYADPLRAVLEFDRLLDHTGGRGRFPRPGERLGPFELVSVLGEGASGRTYVALESSLADRPVVLKVMPVEHVEHLNLARLQHTHIMPLYSEMVLEEKGLRILVMPYLGGIGLDRIFKTNSGRDLSKRSGRGILELIDKSSIEESSRTTSQGTSRAFFDQASYTDAIAYIGQCLADAAAEAHSRGLVHMDIKPSNVLISADARPMLLDFHLARSPVRKGDLTVERLGGTPGWTSPEQNACFDATVSDKPMPSDIDGRSDIYAIGAIMARTLRIDDPKLKGRPEFFPDVSTGLGDIIRKCMSESPSDRYPNAYELAEDLRRFLAHEPLKGVSNRDPFERIKKWRTRNPAGPVWVLAALLLLIALVVGLRQLDRARQKAIVDIRSTIDEARRLENAGLYDTALERLERIRQEAMTLPGFRAEIESIIATENDIHDASRLAELHRASELLRLELGTRNLPEARRQELLKHCELIWDNREELMKATTHAEIRFAGTREEVIRKLVEIVVMLAEMTYRPDVPKSRQAAEQAIAEAESMFGPRFALSLARSSIDSRSARPKDISLPPSSEPSSAWDYDQLGRFHSRNGRSSEAAAAFENAVAMEPDKFWYQFDLAICRYSRSEWQRSLTAWSAAIALRPESAPCRYDRGLTHEAMGRQADAMRDYYAALELDPNLGKAAIRAAMLVQRTGDEAGALKLLEKVARKQGDSKTRAHAWARIVAIHANAGREVAAQEALSEAAALGLVADDPNLIRSLP
jgi:serine/threonine protein kinase